jgi:hypothetical protein
MITFGFIFCFQTLVIYVNFLECCLSWKYTWIARNRRPLYSVDVKHSKGGLDDISINSMAEGYLDIIHQHNSYGTFIHLLPLSIPFDKTITSETLDNSYEIALALLSEIGTLALNSSVIDYYLVQDALLEDISGCIRTVQQLHKVYNKEAAPSNIICRLSLITSVKCPKWHEDNVRFRLLKTFAGEGTEWVSPTKFGVRALNYLRTEILDLDATVFGDNIVRAEPGDVLILRGKTSGAKGHFSAPVLHRSPMSSEMKPRLLLTITIV